MEKQAQSAERAPRRKRGKTAWELHQKAENAEINIINRDSFFDLVEEALGNKAKLPRRLYDMRKRLADPRPRLSDGEEWLIRRRQLRKIAVHLANATGFAGAPPHLPQLIEAWRIDPDLLMLFIELCIATAADPKKVLRLRRNQVLLASHDKVVAIARRAKNALKGQTEGKVSGDAIGKAHRQVFQEAPATAEHFKVKSSAAIKKAANRLGLESGVRISNSSDHRIDAKTLRGAERALKKAGWQPES